MRQYIDTSQDTSGNAIVGATCLVQNYPSGTNASIFSDNGLTPIGSSTVTTDVTGQYSFFAPDGDYILVLSVNATVYKTLTPVTIFDGTPQLTGIDTGTANAYAVSNSTLEKALRVGLRTSFKATNSSTGASTFTYNGLAPKPLVFPATSPILSGTIVAGGIYAIEYDGTNWQMRGAIGATPIFPQTAAEAAASVTPSNTLYEPWRGEDVRRFGVLGDGSTDNTAKLVTANSIGASLYFAPGVYIVSSSMTFTVPLIMDYGAILKPASSAVTISINAPVDAGPWQIFDESASGVISGLIRPVNAAGRMYFEWWGAKGDNSTDDTIPCQSTLRAAMTANYIGIQMLSKQYRITATLNGNGNTTQSFKAPSIFGVGRHLSQFTCTTGIYMLSYIGGSGTDCDTILADIGFSGTANAAIAIKVNGQNGMRYQRCLFDNLQIGIHFWNFTAGSFTEFNVAEDCEFTFNCLTFLYYQVSSGTNSFHGSGILRGLMTSNTTGAMVVVNSGCRPYEAPFDGQVFYANSNVMISNLSALAIDFQGRLTTENVGGGVLTLGATGNVPYVGNISASQQNVVAGTLTMMQGVITNSNTIQTYLGARKSYILACATGANILASSVFNQHRLVMVRFLATGYDYRYLLGVDPSGGATAGVVGTIVNYLATNTAGYGAPTFTVNTSGNLVATNGSWPASGVTAYYGDSTVGFGNETLEAVQF